MASKGNAQLEKVLETQMMKAAQLIEERLDSEIDRLENMKDEDIENVRERRLRQMKDQAKQKDEWRANGHGVYSELGHERQFFDECNRSMKLVCHFYRESTFRCGIVDRHLRLLAQRHLECKFMRISVDSAPFLTRRLGIRVLPTICIVTNMKIRDYIVGFDELGGVDDFSTEMLEWRIAKAEAIDYKGDLSAPPEQQRRQPATNVVRRSIRGDADDNSSGDEDDW